MFRKLLCSIGLHKWLIFYSSKPRMVQQCQYCSKRRSTMYDLSYGGTYWVTGDAWSQYLDTGYYPIGDEESER